MAEDVKLPGIGNVQKKYLLWGGVAAAGIAGIVILRNRSAASAASPATGALDTSGTASGSDGSGYYDTSGTDLGAGYGGSSYGYGGNNPGYDAAGFPVGSQADLQWEGQQSGLGGTPTGITTNDQWISEALGNVPGNQGTIHSALAAVLGGLTVTTAQKNLFLEAKGINGDPPQGYPSPIKTVDTPAHPAGQSQKVKVPVVTGETIADAERELVAVGLKAKVSGKIPPGKHGLARTQSPRGGTVVARNSSVTLTVKVV